MALVADYGDSDSDASGGEEDNAPVAVLVSSSKTNVFSSSTISDIDSLIVDEDDEFGAPSPPAMVPPLPPRGKLNLRQALPKPKVASEIVDGDEKEEEMSEIAAAASSLSSSFSDTEQPKARSSLFAALPTPSTRPVEPAAVESLDEEIEDFVKKKEVPVETPIESSILQGVKRTAAGKVKITVPSLKDVSKAELIILK
jgi:hypothetical protein